MLSALFSNNTVKKTAVKKSETKKQKTKSVKKHEDKKTKCIIKYVLQ